MTSNGAGRTGAAQGSLALKLLVSKQRERDDKVDIGTLYDALHLRMRLACEEHSGRLDVEGQGHIHWKGYGRRHRLTGFVLCRVAERFCAAGTRHHSSSQRGASHLLDKLQETVRQLHVFRKGLDDCRKREDTFLDRHMRRWLRGGRRQGRTVQWRCGQIGVGVAYDGLVVSLYDESRDEHDTLHSMFVVTLSPADRQQRAVGDEGGATGMAGPFQRTVNTNT